MVGKYSLDWEFEEEALQPHSLYFLPKNLYWEPTL